MFFSLSVSWGGLIMFGSYNKFRHRVHYPALIISSLDFLTSIIGTFYRNIYIEYIFVGTKIMISFDSIIAMILQQVSSSFRSLVISKLRAVMKISKTQSNKNKAWPSWPTPKPLIFCTCRNYGPSFSSSCCSYWDWIHNLPSWKPY